MELAVTTYEKTEMQLPIFRSQIVIKELKRYRKKSRYLFK